MSAARIAKFAAGLHVALAAAAIYYTVRINNDADLSDVSVKEYLAMAAILLLPLVASRLGLRLARSDGAGWLLAAGHGLALVLFAATFFVVVRSTEAMAPLLFLLVSIWLAVGFAVLLVIVWVMGRRG